MILLALLGCKDAADDSAACGSTQGFIAGVVYDVDGETPIAGATVIAEGPDGAPRDESRAQVARELARMNLSLNFYTQWYWKTDLHNLLHFLRLRADAHAQYEIRVYADVLTDVLERWVPMTHSSFVNYRLGSAQISKQGMEALRRMLAGEDVTAKDVGMSAGEWREFQAQIRPAE